MNVKGKHISIFHKEDCCGCTACASACPHDALAMVPDGMVFYYPLVDEDKCVDCGICVSKCQFNDHYNRYDNFEEPLVYAARSKQFSDLDKSQTGGLAFILSSSFTENGGIVCGATFDKPDHIIHSFAESSQACDKFRGSKYVQSDILTIFKKVLDLLKTDKSILFIGTPCQVSGLKSYIPNRFHSRLFTVDIVCHGVSSPMVWKDHILDIERKYKQKIVSANFRNKRFGWHSCKETLTLENGSEVYPYTFNLLKDLSVRPSCGNCKYTNTSRVADITVGDFWGWEKYHEEWNDDKGISLLMVNSSKGKQMFEEIGHLVDYRSETLKHCLQPQLLHPQEVTTQNQQFAQSYQKKGYKYVARKFGDQGLKYKLMLLYAKSGMYKFKQLIFKR